MDTPQILIEARALIEDPAHHTKGTFARDKDGESCDLGSAKAVAWCGIGAIASERRKIQ